MERSGVRGLPTGCVLFSGKKFPRLARRAASALLFGAGLCLAQGVSASVPGTVVGAFSVDPSGAANYVIPIAVPPGVAGLQPDIKLSYSSRAPDGQLGMGWSLSGLSAVTRCPKNLDVDGLPGGVLFQTSDKFCLDGQRLSAAPGDTYGGNGSLYYTKVANFQSIVSRGTLGGGPGYFKVWSRDGTIRTYGTNGTCTMAASNSACVSWPITEMDDHFGNSISYTYSVGNNEYRLSEIDYANDAGTVVGKVTFGYTTARPDKYYKFAGGYSANVTLNQTYRLATINVYAGSTYVRRYALGYVTSGSGRSLLSSVTQCSDSAQTNCLPPTTFQWSQVQTGFSSTAGTPTYVSDAAANMQPGDFDGDGITDYIFSAGGALYVKKGSNVAQGQVGIGTNTGYTLQSNDEPQYMLVGDLDGDGCSDVLMPVAGGLSSAYWRMLLSDCAGHLAESSHYFFSKQAESKHPLLADLNGDGYPDLVYKYNGTLWTAKGGASGFGTPTDSGLTVVDQQVLYPLNFLNNGFGQVYVTNDGCPDATGGGSGGGGTGGGGFSPLPGTGGGNIHQFSVTNGGGSTTGNGGVSSTSTATVIAAGTTSCAATAGILEWSPSAQTLIASGITVPQRGAGAFVLLDLNGDGLTDFADYECSGNTCGWFPAINQGASWVWSGFASVPTFTDTNQTATMSGTRVIDYDGDGQMDLIFPDPSGNNWKVEYSTGAGLAAPAGTGMTATAAASAMVVDFDGDGLPDLLYPGTNYWRAYVRGNGQPPDLMTQVTDGLGRNTYVEYKPLNTLRVSLYGGPMDNASAPNLNLPTVRNFLGPIYVVYQYGISSAVQQTGVADPVVNTRYQYWGAKLDAGGIGFLGFYQVLSQNLNSGIVTVNVTAQQTYPFTGMVTESDVYATGGGSVNSIQATSGSDILARIGGTCHFTADGGDCDTGVPTVPPPPTVPSSTTLVDKTVYTLASLTPSGGTGRSLFPYVVSSVRSRYGLNRGSSAAYQTVTTNYTYDVWGQATEIAATTTDSQVGDSLTVDTRNTYGANDTAYNHWCLGRLTDSQVIQSYIYNDNTGSPITGSQTHEATFSYFPFGTAQPGASCALQTEVANANSATPLTTTYTYDTNGNKLTATQTGSGIPAGGYTTTTAYDANGHYPVSVTNPLGQTTTTAWDPRFGSKTSVTDPNGVNVTTSYDAFGRKLHQSGPRSTQTVDWAYAWCASCRAPTAVYYTTETHSDGQLIRTQYDAAGRAVMTRHKVLGGSDVDVFTVYDPLGRAYMASAPVYDIATGGSLCWTYNSYDIVGRVLEADTPAQGSPCGGPSLTTAYASYIPSAPAGQAWATTTSSYNKMAVTVMDANGHSVTRTDNAFAKPWRVSDAKSTLTTYGYDAFGNTSDVWIAGYDTRTSHTHMDYDVRGFKTAMSDPDMGNWSYSYDALGRLTGQTNANGQSVSLVYDALNRLTQRLESEGTTTWTYDTAANGIGKLASVTAPNNYSASYSYTAYGEAQSSTVTPGMGSPAYTVTRGYDGQGRLATVTYPSFTVGGSAYSLTAGYCYDGTGHLTTVYDTGTGQACGSVSQYYWQASTSDERDNLTEDFLGAGPGGASPLIEDRTFDDATGKVASIGVTSPTATLASQAYSWDLIGNLSGRADGVNASQETFTYDALDRMNGSTLTVGSVANGQSAYQYDSLGNLRLRDSTVSSYTYQADANPSGGSGPHTLQAATVNGSSQSFSYDADGNVTAEGGRTLTWSSYDKPTFITDAAKHITEQFLYGPDRELYQQTATDTSNGHTVTTTHLGDLVDIQDDSQSGRTVRLYVAVGGTTVAMQVIQGTTLGQVVYLLHDALGSVIAQATNLGGTWSTSQQVGYDAWGQSRNASTGITDMFAFLLPQAEAANLGFEGHTNLEVGLVHMGGRIYDPVIGRFLTADPNVQYPLSPQSYNRYVYVNNNPLSFTDPTGYFSFGDLVMTAAIIGIAIATSGWAAQAYMDSAWSAGAITDVATGMHALAMSEVIGGMAGGAVAGFLSTPGNLGDRLGGALGGGLSGGMFGAIGGQFDSPAAGSSSYFEKAAAEGLVGGAMSEAGGGRFGDGFLGGAVGSMDEPLLGDIGTEHWYNRIAQAMTAASIGGTLSELSGGEFANGAVTAAFQNLFNAQGESRTKENAHGSNDETSDDLSVNGSFYFDKKNNRLFYIDGTQTIEWSADSGPWGEGPLQNGVYTLGELMTVPASLSNGAYCDGSGNCWFQKLYPQFNTDRTGLGIHPDGNIPGTLGCIGITDSYAEGLHIWLTEVQPFRTLYVY